MKATYSELTGGSNLLTVEHCAFLWLLIARQSLVICSFFSFSFILWQQAGHHVGLGPAVKSGLKGLTALSVLRACSVIQPTDMPGQTLWDLGG